MKINRNCISCNSTDLKLLPGYEIFLLCKCNSCSLAFLLRRPTIEELEKYYKNYGIENYLSPITIKRYNEILDKFEPFRKTNKILDLGCGIGYFLIEAKKRGWEVYGTELSKDSAQICIEKGINMKVGSLQEDWYAKEIFDIITSFEVIEHINCPIEELSIMKNILRKGGLVYVTTPNFNSLLRYKLKENYNIFIYPEHLTYYTPYTLKKTFKRVGFKSYKTETTGLSLTRYKTSSGLSEQSFISATSDDEKLRNKMDTVWYYIFVKNIINKGLSLFGVGDSLKGWFIKP